MKTFNVQRRGYNTVEVDEYIHELESKLNKAEKQVNDYRQKEAAINQSVVEAKLLANKITEEANADAAKMKDEALASMTELRSQVKAMHEKLQAFQQNYNALLQHYLVSVRCTDLNNLFNDLDQFMDKLGMKPAEDETITAPQPEEQL